MSCCQIATGCGVPVTGCVGTGVPSGFVSVDLQSTQMPLYVDVCGNLLYYYTGASWVVLGKDEVPGNAEEHLVYEALTRKLTLLPANSQVELPLAGAGVAGLVKLGVDSPISVTTDGALVIDCAKLKAQCSILSPTNTPTGNVITYNTTTNVLDIDCAKLKEKCGLASLTDLPISGTVVKINPTSKALEVDCTALKAQCNLATMDDIPTIPPAQTLPVSGPVVKINPTTNVLEVDCASLKSQCNLATMDDIPTIPATPVYNFGQQASLNGTILHIANSQDVNAGVDVDLSSLVGNSGGTGTYNINQAVWYDGINSQFSESEVIISAGWAWPGQSSSIPAGTQFRIALTSPPPTPWQLTETYGLDATNVLPALEGISGVVQEMIEYLVTAPCRLRWDVPHWTGGPRTDITVIGTLSPR